MKTYKGYYRPKNPHKYKGTIPIIYRSSWEYAVMKWLDEQSAILSWGSESIVIPYYCEIDKKIHRYFVDFDFTHKNGQTYLVEIKPEKYTIPPVKPKERASRKYLKEVIEWQKNTAKWISAKKWSEDRGYKFQVWTQHTIKRLGIKIIT